MRPEDIFKYMEGLEKGRPVFEALSKIKDPVVVKSVLAASMDAWCMANDYDVCELADEIADTIREVNNSEEED